MVKEIMRSFRCGSKMDTRDGTIKEEVMLSTNMVFCTTQEDFIIIV